MAETPSPSSAAAGTDGSSQYWCYHCEKRVSVETVANLPDVICLDCKNGFVESIPAGPSTPPSISATPSLISDPSEETFGSQFLQMLRIIAQAAREEPSHHRRDAPQSEDDFLRIDLDGWDNGGDEAEDGEEGEEEEEDDDVEDVDVDDEEDRRRRREILRLRIRDFATRTRTGRNRILDWAEILMGLEDNSIEFRLEVPESDRYIGNPEDYVDAAGYEALLQNLADSDGGRKGAPPASKSAVSALPAIEVTSEGETSVCAVCKDMVNVGEKETKLPCGHGYHGDCIVPWLGSRNSCPICRFELPTDDTEYEEEKRKKGVAAASGGWRASASGGGDSSGSSI
ncbi:unnamed protein product [Linum tenue]|uniref:RING-type E3 ubiquitin transferase n=2 Tax=Linum tenue TaxID=586396 RepID=A0AAV0R2N0_9ROSI|nr:unnamed protein product [Linum tenue]CAI0551745.1 unnamed protein product [Linum tenue]